MYQKEVYKKGWRCWNIAKHMLLRETFRKKVMKLNFNSVLEMSGYFYGILCVAREA